MHESFLDARRSDVPVKRKQELRESRLDIVTVQKSKTLLKIRAERFINKPKKKIKPILLLIKKSERTEKSQKKIFKFGNIEAKWQ